MRLKIHTRGLVLCIGGLSMMMTPFATGVSAGQPSAVPDGSAIGSTPSLATLTQIETSESASDEPSASEPMEITTIPDDFTPSLAMQFPDEVGVVSAAAEAAFGSRIAFVSDHESALRLWLVGPTSEADRLLGEGIGTRNVPVEVASAIASHEQLVEAARELQSSIGSRSDEVVIAIRPTEQTITLGLPPDADPADAAIHDQWVASARSIVGRLVSESPADARVDDVLRVTTATGTNLAGAGEYAELPPRGGRHIAVTATDGYVFGCTIGFYVKTSPATGSLERMLSAAHCANYAPGLSQVHMANGDVPYSPWQYNGDEVGTIRNTGPSGYDVMSFNLVDVPGGYDGEPVVTVSNTGNFRYVEAQRSGQAQQFLEDYCHVGLGIWNEDMDDERCGDFNMQVFNGPILEHCIERRSFIGDSGGPMYEIDPTDGRVTAVGIVTRSVQTDHPWPIPDDWHTCYQNIDELHAALGGYQLVIKK